MAESRGTPAGAASWAASVTASSAHGRGRLRHGGHRGRQVGEVAAVGWLGLGLGLGLGKGYGEG